MQAQNTYIGDDQLYTLSMFDSGLGFYGNRRLLEEAGVRIPTGLDDAWSAEEFEQVLAQLAEADPDGKPLDIKENYGAAYSSYAFLPIVNSAGVEVVVDNRAEGDLNSQPVVDVLEQFSSWRPYVDPNTDDAAFVQERAALSWVGHWVYGSYAEALGDDLVVLPLLTSGSVRRADRDRWRGGSAPRPTRPAAAAFLDYLMSDEWVALMTDGNGAPPGTETVRVERALRAGRCAGAVRRSTGPHVRHRAADRGLCGDPATRVAGVADHRRAVRQGVVRRLQRRRRADRARPSRTDHRSRLRGQR